MTDKPHIVERAFQIAWSGETPSTNALINPLKSEGYENYRQHITGSLRMNLRKLIKAALRRRTDPRQTGGGGVGEQGAGTY